MKKRSKRRKYRYPKDTRKRRSHRRWLFFGLLLTLLVASAVSLSYILFKAPIGEGEKKVVFIYPEDSPEAIYQRLEDSLNIKYPKLFRYLAQTRRLNNRSRGRYELNPKESLWETLDRLLQRNQSSVRLVINQLRTEGQLASLLSEKLLLDSADLRASLHDHTLIHELEEARGKKDSLFMALDSVGLFYAILPDTYEVYWDTTPSELLRKLAGYYNKFWTPERIESARAIGLSPLGVSTLASIVEEESNKRDEHAQIARLYLNRLKINMPLQADPTVKYAVGDFSLRRILLTHTQVDSPYNTYKKLGLPPTPIRMPERRTLEAVLSAPEHNFLYMVAKEDFSGYHRFSKNYLEHLRNARLYQKALNERGIR